MRDTRKTKRKKADNWLRLVLIERNIRFRTEQLYDARGHAEGRELEDWLKALSQALQLTALTPDFSNEKDLFEHHARAAKIA